MRIKTPHLRSRMMDLALRPLPRLEGRGVSLWFVECVVMKRFRKEVRRFFKGKG
jgi:hypothetical protein